MGYETQLLIGHDTGNSFSGTGIFFMVYATIDLCKLGNSALFDLPWENKTPDEASWYWYPPTSDGNTIVSEDPYGDIPQPVPIADVISALEEDVANDDYRRLHWALGMLKAMQAEARGEELSVLLWGH